VSEEQTEEQAIREVSEETRPPVPQAQKTPERKRGRFTLEKFRPIAEAYKWITRAGQGLDLDPDKYEGMMNVKDIKERTRITTGRIRRSTYCRILAESGDRVGGLNPYDIFKDIADTEDTYFIAKDGEQRKEAILLRRTETQTPSAVANISLPQVETQAPTPKKSHWWNRGRGQGGGNQNQ
jgi:hypothetical protein